MKTLKSVMETLTIEERNNAFRLFGSVREYLKWKTDWENVTRGLKQVLR